MPAVMTKLFDITLPLRNALAPWPGDTAFRFVRTWEMSAGAAVNVGAVTMGVHNGTHADAPCHFRAEGVAIDALPLEIFCGPAVVLDLSARRLGDPCATITLPELESAVADLARAPRLLLKTGGWPDSAHFPPCIPVVAPDVPAWLGEHGVILLGLDVPSVDAVDSKTMSNHHALFEAGVSILESLDLRAVPAGVYELIALPLKLVGGDAAPVRAVLRTLH